MGDADVNPTELLRALDQNRRAIRLDWGRAASEAAKTLVPQYADIRQGLCAGLQAQVVCLSERSDLPLHELLGLPVSIQLATDEGALYPVNGIVTDVQAGAFDGTLASYRLTVSDAMSLMRGRRNMRVFVGKSVPEILETLLGEWRERSSAMARMFDFELLLDRSRYPGRAQTLQLDESDSGFLDRLSRHEGIWCFVKAGTRDGASSDTPVHTLVFCDDPMRLPQSPAGTVPYHYGATVKTRDSITRWGEARSLVSGSIRGASPDHETGKVDRVEVSTLIDQGKAGNDLASLLTDASIDRPHAGDSREDYERLGKLRIQAHERRAACVHAASDVRNLAPGFWFTLIGHSQVDKREPKQREFVVASLHQRAANNFPKELEGPARALADANGWHLEVGSGADDQVRYENTFTCVLRGVPLTPDYDPRVDLPRTEPMSALVVGPQGEEVHCDEMGRFKLQFQGLTAEDHAHAQGAGTSGTERDSAWVRLGNVWAGHQYGINMPLRAGMEVLVAFANGDPDRPYIAAVLSGAVNMPATFSNTGSLPGNRYISGIKSKEINGSGYGQLRFDDTSGQVSSQLASTHATSELNLGYLTHPRTDGSGKDRGEGAELATGAAAALRAAKGILLTTYALKAGHQLDRDELNQLLGECTDLFKSLGDYAGQHGGKPGDTAAQDKLAATLKSWDPSGAKAGAMDDAQAILALGAAAGSVNLTPKTHVTYAGENIDQVAQQHLQLVGGQRLNATAGQGMHLFARGEGIQAVANEGPLVLQAQADTFTATAQKDIKLTSNEGNVVISGKTLCLVAEDGSYIKIGGGVTLGTNDAAKILAASHDWGGPSTVQAERTAFAKAPTDQRFRVHYPGDSEAPIAYAANQPHGIRFPDGSLVEGKSDTSGLTDILKDNAMSIAHIDVLKPKL